MRRRLAGSARAALVVVTVLRGTLAAGGQQDIGDEAPLMEVAAFIEARGAFERNCYRCHTTSGEESSKKAMEKLDMDRYPFLGRRAAVAGKVTRKSLGGNGGKQTMPKDSPESVGPDDLAVMLRWADAFELARAKSKDKE